MGDFVAPPIHAMSGDSLAREGTPPYSIPMSERSGGKISWVMVPAAVTLVVLLVRLFGELQGWSTEAFGVEAGGGSAPMTKDNPQPVPSWFGIFWLMPLVGIYLAVRLQRNGGGPAHRGKALLFALIAFGLFAGTAAYGMHQMNVEQDGDPTKPVPFFQTIMYTTIGAGWVGVILAFIGWGRLAFLQFVYAILARLPVIILTIILVPMNKGTHFEKLAPMAPKVEDSERIFFLCFAQVGFWIPLTVLFGVLAGTVVSFLVPARRVD